MNVLVLLPRLQIAIHFVVPIPAPYKSSLHFQYVYGSFQVSNKHVVGCDIYIYINLPNPWFLTTHNKPLSKNLFFFFFRLWCGFPQSSPTAVALDSHWSHASASLLRWKFGPRKSPWNTIFPVGKHPVEDGRWKKNTSFETENVNSHETPRWLQGARWVRPGDLGGAGGELLGCPVGSW